MRPQESAEVADVFPQLWTPVARAPALPLAEALSAATTWVRFDRVAETLAHPGDDLLLVVRGEVEVIRRPAGCASPTLLRVGRGSVLNARALATGAEALLMPALAPVATSLRSVVPPTLVKLNWKAALGTLKVDAAARAALVVRLKSLFSVDTELEQLVATLRTLPAFQRLSLSRLYRLLGWAERHEMTSHLICAPLDEEGEGDNAGIYIPRSGSLRLSTPPAAGGVAAPAGRVLPWRAFNSLDLAGPVALEPEPSPVEYYFIPAGASGELLASSELFRRHVQRTAVPGSQTAVWGRIFDLSSVELVAFDGEDAKTREHLADELARALVDEHHDRVLRLEVGPSVATAPAGPKLDVNAPVHRLTVQHSPPPQDEDLLGQWTYGHLVYWLGNLLSKYDYVLATTADGKGDFHKGLQRRADTRVVLSPEPLPKPAPQPTTLTDLQVRPEDDPEVLSVFAAYEGVTTPGASAPFTTPISAPLRWSRVRFPNGLPDTRDVARLARALSGRMVGVALGGGGALGLANVALLESMLRAGIPVDMVTGNSFGSVAGAFFAAYEPDANGHHPGLERLQSMRHRLKLQAATLGAVLIPGLIRRHVDGELGDLRVRDCPIRFLPFSVRADSLDPVLIENATLGDAVAASGAAPAVFAPVRLEDGGERVRFLDGAVVANVPAEALLEAGCGVITAMDPIPRAANPDGSRTLDGAATWLLDFIEPFDLLGLAERAVDGVRACERALSLMSESSSSPADLALKVPFGAVLRMPFFLYTDDLMDVVKTMLDTDRVSDLVAALAEDLKSPANPAPVTPTPFMSHALDHRREGIEQALIDAKTKAGVALGGLPSTPWKP